MAVGTVVREDQRETGRKQHDSALFCSNINRTISSVDKRSQMGLQDASIYSALEREESGTSMYFSHRSGVYWLQ